MFDAAISLAGDCSNLAAISKLCAESKQIIAADGGADNIQRAGFYPDWFVGDGDSVKLALPDSTAILRLTEDKNYTDGELALALAILSATSGKKIKSMPALKQILFQKNNIPSASELTIDQFSSLLAKNLQEAEDLSNYTFLVLFPFGVRIDHSMMNILLAATIARAGATIYLSDGVILARIINGSLRLEKAFSTKLYHLMALDQRSDIIFSALPLDDNVKGFAVKDLKWELEDTEIKYNHAFALSNRAKDKKSTIIPRIALQSGTVLLMLTPNN